jgi:hypothetical protein
LFFVVRCGLAAVFGRPRLFLSVSPIGLVLVLLLDPNIPAYLLAARSGELRNAFVVGATLFVITLISSFNRRSLIRIISDSTTLHNNENPILLHAPI